MMRMQNEDTDKGEDKDNGEDRDEDEDVDWDVGADDEVGEGEDQDARVEVDEVADEDADLTRMTMRLTMTSIVINHLFSSFRCNLSAILCHLFTNRDEL